MREKNKGRNRAGSPRGDPARFSFSISLSSGATIAGTACPISLSSGAIIAGTACPTRARGHIPKHGLREHSPQVYFRHFLSGPPRRGRPPPRHGADRTTTPNWRRGPSRITSRLPGARVDRRAGSGSGCGAPGPRLAGPRAGRPDSGPGTRGPRSTPEMISIPDQRIMARPVRLMLKFSMGAFQRRNGPLVPESRGRTGIKPGNRSGGRHTHVLILPRPWRRPRAARLGCSSADQRVQHQGREAGRRGRHVPGR